MSRNTEDWMWTFVIVILVAYCVDFNALKCISLGISGVIFNWRIKL